GTGGYLDRIKTERVTEFLDMLLARLRSEKQELMDKIAGNEWDDDLEADLGEAIAEAIDDFGADFDAEGNPIEQGESDRIVSEDERRREARTDEGRASADDDGDEPEREEETAAVS